MAGDIGAEGAVPHQNFQKIGYFMLKKLSYEVWKYNTHKKKKKCMHHIEDLISFSY